MSTIGKTTMVRLNTLRGFVFSATVGVALLVFLGATLASSLLYEGLLHKRMLEMSHSVARENVQAIASLLRAGASQRQLARAASSAQARFPTLVDEIRVYAGAPSGVRVSRQGQGSAPPPVVQQALQSARAQRVALDQRIIYAFPVLARQACLACHHAAHPGQVLGAIAIEHNLRPVTTAVRLGYIALFLGLGSIVLVAATGLSAYAARKINRAVGLLHDRVESVHAIRDFERLNLDGADFGFEELNRTFAHVTRLVQKIRGIAVDKEVLEFEIALLEKFIITSDVVRDWREFIAQLLLEINPIIEAYALVTIFRIDEEGYECEVFWRNPPSSETLRLFEQILRRQLGAHAVFQGAAALPIQHNVASKHGELPALAAEDIELQTKTLLLETPRIGGIVGIGVQSSLVQDTVRNMVIGSILTTLLNLVGSVKAIYKYTKDLEYYATRDPLTDLFNQRMFWELLGYEVNRARRHKQQFAILVLDLDNFKHVNDGYGHHFGDRLLQAFANLLHGAVRDGDIVTRYGGDEFCVVLPEASDTQAHLIAQRIHDQLRHFSLGTPAGGTVTASVSIGIAVYPAHGDNPKDLFLVADNMVYKAKSGGKASIAIPNEEEMAAVFRKAGEKSVMIQNALDRQKIIPYFQPICEASSGHIVIHELLMRIQLGGDVISANEFISEAESMGVAHKMDYQLIEKAFGQMREQNYSGMLFVNLSPKSLIVGEFGARVSHLAGKYGISPARIVFEITERETVSNLSLLEKFVLDVKLQGFSFAIDDFGSGYSSFHYIKRFPVDYIKIEGEFIRNMRHDEQYLAFVKSIVTLAKELKVKTIAEFVEDEPTFAMARSLGIDYAQGYHIARPAAAFTVQTVVDAR
ncbi:MAG: bifunctional diguanylate cyclase/phosphodiesterase [Betaproteobacteria bacterium]|nr:bifunctional diguanylate cyclase/phosphodiesterase [Betaproteobacteria bacterium]